MRIASLRERLAALGANPRHQQRVLRLWRLAQPQRSGRRALEHFRPHTLVNAMPEIEAELAALGALHSEHPGEDGSSRLLVKQGDGQMVESVLLPRGGLCVSTQVGCAVGCVFCMTGTTGLVRQVGSAEIVAQLALARRMRPVKRVVFMGMGEPAHNLDNVMEGIVRLLAGKYAMLNMIPHNAVPELPYQRPRRENAADIAGPHSNSPSRHRAPGGRELWGTVG